MEDLPQEFLIDSVNIEFLNIRTGEVTSEAYLASITETVKDSQQVGTGALLIIKRAL